MLLSIYNTQQHTNYLLIKHTNIYKHYYTKNYIYFFYFLKNIETFEGTQTETQSFKLKHKKCNMLKYILKYTQIFPSTHTTQTYKTDTNKKTHNQKYRHTNIYTKSHPGTHTQTPTLTNNDTHTQTPTPTHTQTHTNTPTHTHTHTHKHTHTHTQTHTQKHTYTY